MIIQITKVTKNTMRGLNIKFGQNQSKFERVMAAWNVLLKIENKTDGRFSDHQNSKKRLLRCFGHIFHISRS